MSKNDILVCYYLAVVISVVSLFIPLGYGYDYGMGFSNYEWSFIDAISFCGFPIIIYIALIVICVVSSLLFVNKKSRILQNIAITFSVLYSLLISIVSMKYPTTDEDMHIGVCGGVVWIIALVVPCISYLYIYQGDEIERNKKLEDEKRAEAEKRRKEHGVVAVSILTPSQSKEDSVITEAENLLQYKKLLDEGIITQEEYNKAKKKILNI